MKNNIGHAMNVLIRLFSNKIRKNVRKVNVKDGNDIVNEMYGILYNKNNEDYLRKSMIDLMDKIDNGISPKDLYRSLENIILNSNLEEEKNNSNAALANLENEIKDIRRSINLQNEVGSRLSELQEQVENIKNHSVPNDNVSLEKQEDALQNFLSSDKKAFIIMPFQKEFDNVWQGAIKPACSEGKYVPLRLDEVSLSSLITDDIEKYSTMANVVVVDLTGNNPNVMFELGWSLAKNKKPIVICQGEHTSKVAFDARGIRHIQYENTWLGIEDLKKKIKNFINATDGANNEKQKNKNKRKNVSRKKTPKNNDK